MSMCLQLISLLTHVRWPADPAANGVKRDETAADGHQEDQAERGVGLAAHRLPLAQQRLSTQQRERRLGVR